MLKLKLKDGSTHDGRTALASHTFKDRKAPPSGLWVPAVRTEAGSSEVSAPRTYLVPYRASRGSLLTRLEGRALPLSTARSALPAAAVHTHGSRVRDGRTHRRSARCLTYGASLSHRSASSITAVGRLGHWLCDLYVFGCCFSALLHSER